MSKTKRTALLIRCSVEEARQIRAAAQKQRRTLSGYVLHCLHVRLRIEAELQKSLLKFMNAKPGVLPNPE